MLETPENKSACETARPLRVFKIVTVGLAEQVKVSFPLEDEPEFAYVIRGEAVMNPNKRSETGIRLPSEALMVCNSQFDPAKLSRCVLWMVQFVYFPNSPLPLAIPPSLTGSPEFNSMTEEQKLADEKLESIAKSPGEFARVSAGDPNIPQLLQAIRRRQRLYVRYLTYPPENACDFLPQIPKQ